MGNTIQDLFGENQSLLIQYNDRILLGSVLVSPAGQSVNEIISLVVWYTTQQAKPS